MFKSKQVHNVQLKQTQNLYNIGCGQKLNKFNTLRFMVLDCISMV